jgi:hypothetical protein
MSEYKIELIGDEEIAALLEVLSKPYFLQPAFNRIGARLRTEMAKYPPPPPDSKYRRTGKLGRSWAHEVKSSLFAMEAIIGNNTPYAPDVQGEGQQAGIHQGRWQTDQEVLDANTHFVLEEIGEEVDKVLRS